MAEYLGQPSRQISPLWKIQGLSARACHPSSHQASLEEAQRLDSHWVNGASELVERGLRHGENAAQVPRSRLGQDASAAQDGVSLVSKILSRLTAQDRR